MFLGLDDSFNKVSKLRWFVFYLVSSVVLFYNF